MPQPPRTVVLSKKEVGRRVRTLRKERGISQVELAELLGTYQTVISAIERGVRGLTLQQIVKLAGALGASPNDLLLKTPAPQREAFDRRFLKRFREIDKLPKRKKQALLVTLDDFLKGAGVP